MLGVVAQAFPGTPLSVLEDEPLGIYFEVMEDRAFAESWAYMKTQGGKTGPRKTHPMDEVVMDVISYEMELEDAGIDPADGLPGEDGE